MDIVLDKDDIKEVTREDLDISQSTIQGDGLATPKRVPKQTAAMLKASKELNFLLQALKTPNPTKLVRLHFQRQIGAYADLIKVVGAIKEETTKMFEPLEVGPEIVSQLQ